MLATAAHPRLDASARWNASSMTPDPRTGRYTCYSNRWYHNEADQHLQVHLTRASLQDSPHGAVFHVGTSNGKEILRLVSQPWFGNASVHGWELSPVAFKRAQNMLQAFPAAKLYNAGVSDAQERVEFKDSDGATTTHILSSDATARGRLTSVSSVRWADEVARLGIQRVAYALIDVEGFEVRVLRGMELHREEMRDVFPAFQLEVHSKVWQANVASASWAQTEPQVLLRLEGLGYRLFLIGMDEDHQPLLLPLSSQGLTDTWPCRRLGTQTFGRTRPDVTQGPVGNVLALLPPPDHNAQLWHRIQRMIVRATLRAQESGWCARCGHVVAV